LASNSRGVKDCGLTHLLAANLLSRQELENPHGPLATRATSHCRFSGVGRPCWRRSRQQSSAEWQKPTAPPIRHEAEVLDAREASWEHVFEKAAQEDLMRECHRTPLVVMGVVFPAETCVFKCLQADNPVVLGGTAFVAGFLPAYRAVLADTATRQE
jgi:hypothetical protein